MNCGVRFRRKRRAVQVIGRFARQVDEALDLAAPFGCHLVDGQVRRGGPQRRFTREAAAVSQAQQPRQLRRRQERRPGRQVEMDAQAQVGAQLRRQAQGRLRIGHVHHDRGGGHDALQVGLANAGRDRRSQAIVIGIDDQVFHANLPASALIALAFSARPKTAGPPSRPRCQLPISARRRGQRGWQGQQGHRQGADLLGAEAAGQDEAIAAEGVE